MNKKVLVVDDESPIADMLSLFCQAYGFETKVLTNGMDAVAVVKEYMPDLITMDLAMPGTSGAKVIEMLKNDETTKKIPIIVISAYAGAQEVAESLKLSDAVLQKPVRMETLKDKIGTMLASDTMSEN